MCRMVLSNLSAPTPLAPSTFTHVPSEGGDYVQVGGEGLEIEREEIGKKKGGKNDGEGQLWNKEKLCLPLVQAYGKQLLASGSSPLLLECQMLHLC